MRRHLRSRFVLLALLVITAAMSRLPAGHASAQTVQPPAGLALDQVAVGQTGTATARFNITFNCAAVVGRPSGAIQGGTICVDPTTGLPLLFVTGSVLNGNVIFTISDPTVATWTDAVTPTPASAPQTAGFVTTASQTVRRCGFFPTTGFPAAGGTVSTIGPLQSFFGGCESVSAQYRGLRPGITNITATFIPDLPGAFGSPLVGLAPNITPLLGLFVGANPSDTKTLEVVAAPPSGVVQLVRGCNNVSPTVSESASAYAARVTPAAALVALWEHQAATNTFRGFSPQAGAPNDLAAVTRLRPVFVCVNGPATLNQPPA